MTGRTHTDLLHSCTDCGSGYQASGGAKGRICPSDDLNLLYLSFPLPLNFSKIANYGGSGFNHIGNAIIA